MNNKLEESIIWGIGESDIAEIDDLQSMLYYEFHYVDTYELDYDDSMLIEDIEQ